ncbi:hypothetical protein DM02DRAFT_607276, partial [Periconia macrospinosa]
MLADLHTRHGSQFGCRTCFASGKIALGCTECIRELERGTLSPAAHVHNWLRCEHAYPDELKDLSPVEEKLIALNSCYGFITRYNVSKGHRESATYPKHVKGHITVFPNNVQELVTRVLPHPLLKVMDEIHVSWQGTEKPAPKDLSVLLSVRRRAVEKALVWLKRNNPHYSNIEIDTAEMESWGAPSHGVPSQVYERLERDEPSAWEKTRTAQLVPPTERGLEAGEDVDVKEILATLNQPQAVRHEEMEEGGIVAGSGYAEAEADIDGSVETVQEISASGIPTCVKYSINRPAGTRNLCRFKAPWRLVEQTAFKEGGVLEIRRNHNMVNRWNKAISVGLRHNHDISFIGTQSKTLAIVFYVTNYATKLEDPVWKRAAAAAEVLDASRDSGTETGSENRTRQFLARVANRVFTERALSQFTHSKVWTYLNVSSLYWEIFRRWDYLRHSAGEENEVVDEAVILEHSGQKTTFVQAYPHREFEECWPLSKTWAQVLRKRREHAVVCLDGYLSMDFGEEDESDRRAAVQHLAMFVPWEQFLPDSSGDVNAIWEKQKQLLPRRLVAVTENIQLLQRSAEDAKRDARQWAAQSGEADRTVDAADILAGEGEGDECSWRLYRPDKIGSTTRLIDVLRSAIGTNQITAGSNDVRLMIQQLCDFQQVASCSSEDMLAIVDCERENRTIRTLDGTLVDGHVPEQVKVKSIKSQ